MSERDPSHHVFRHVGGASIDGDFIDPAAFRRKIKDDGNIEPGLSVNWVEYFQKDTPEEAVPPLCTIFAQKNRKVGTTSKFALLNVGKAKRPLRNTPLYPSFSMQQTTTHRTPW